MKTSNLFLVLPLVLAVSSRAHAQRQFENLGRGVVAVRTGTSNAYIGWRLLATDPESIGFNVYRSQNGGAVVKLNSQPITNTTDYIDATAALSVSNAWFVRPVSNGVELAASTPFGFPGNAIVPRDFQNKLGPYVRVPLQPIPNASYYTHHVWPGDIDGDGEYDFVATRLPNAGGVSFVDAYLRNGTFLWRMNMGPNSDTGGDFPPTGVSAGHSDNVTVFDMDGDGRAEVLVRTANGVTVTNAAGTQVASVTAGDNLTQFVSVIDGQTGIEKARLTLPNPVPSAGAMSSHFGIMYADGVRPSLVVESINRDANGWFYLSVTCWDYRDGQLKMRWLWTPPNDGRNYSRAHQIRIVDLDHDGRDEFCEISFALRDAGDHAETLFSNELLHGDRFHIADLDPDRPGLESFAIQQDNPNLLATALHDAATGKMIKKWYAAGVVDVGRGNASDIDLNTRGMEVFSTMSGLWSAQGKLVNNSPPYPNFGIWWDADLAREQLDDGKIDKYGVGRILSPYNMASPALDGAPTWRNAQPLYGDLFGDWREEVLFESTDASSLIIFTPVSAATNRLVCLAQNPAYRAGMTVKGYMQSIWPDYYIGAGMGVPPVQPASDAHLVWRGDGAANVWDAAAANWMTNNLWISNTAAVPYFAGASVIFSRTGSNNAPVALAGTLAPSAVKVHSANDYVFNGGELTGGMSLTKAGAGKLTLNNTNTFTGRTLISEGALMMNGELTASPVLVRSGAWLDGRLGGIGQIGGAVVIEQGGGVSPGQGTDSPGTLTLASSLTLRGRTLNDFDLSDDPSGVIATNDRLNVLGNLVLQGTNSIVVRQLNGTLTPGTYTLISCEGALIGGITNLMVEGLDGVPFALTNPPGEIALIVKSTRPPAVVTWAGGANGRWDLVTSSNWWNGGLKDCFVPLDAARFDNTGSSTPTVTLIGSLPVQGVVVDSTANYTFTGSGSISGSLGLVKTNSGTLTMLTENDYTGRTVIGGGVIEVSTLSVSGAPGPFGVTSSSATNLLLFNNATLRVTGGEAYTERGLTLVNGRGRLELPTAGSLVNFAGQIVGAGTLEKSGQGTLILGTANAFSGGTLISGGTLQLGSGTANSSGLGGGAVTLTNGGVLSLFGAGAGDLGTGGAGGPFVNPIHVPAGTSGSFRAPFRFVVNNSLTGAGTLNLGVTGVRGDFNGNWSAFTGTINISSLSGTSDFRGNNSAGFPNARVNLASATTFQNRVSGTPRIPVGELSGANGSIINAPGGNGGLPVTWRVGRLNSDATFAGNAYNTVSFIKEGSGTWTWTGTNIHTGTLTISNGVVQIGNGGTRGTLGTGGVFNYAMLAFNRSDAINDDNFGVIAGTGALAKLGGGRLTLAKAHTFSGATEIQSGAFALTNSGSMANSAEIRISAGALLDVSGVAGGSVTLAAGRSISGNGAVKGGFGIGAGARLQPGFSIGMLTFSNALSISGSATSVFEINPDAATNDALRCISTINLGGTLIVTNIGSGSFAAGNSFKLIHAAGFSGSFSAVILPPLPNALTWDFSTLNIDGTIRVIATPAPVIHSVSGASNGGFQLGFSGAAGKAFELRASTNLMLAPVTDWTLIGSGVFGGGPETFEDLQATNFAQRFYLIHLP